MQKFIWLPCLLLLSYVASAQSNFIGGYLIAQQGDTLRGELAVQNDAKNYVSATFRQNGKVQEYKPNEILGFGYDQDKAFVSGIKADAFVELLISGTLSLYKYEKQYYLQKANDIKVLEYQQHAARLGYSEQKKEDNRWKGIMSYMTSDCATSGQIAKQIQRISFQEKSITKVVIAYNNCVNSDYISPKEENAWTQVDMGLTVGLARTKIQDVEAFSDPSVKPIIGLMFNFNAPRVSRHLSFQAEVLYTQASYESSTSWVASPGRMFFVDYSLRFSKISTPISLKYLFNHQMCIIMHKLHKFYPILRYVRQEQQLMLIGIDVFVVL